MVSCLRDYSTHESSENDHILECLDYIPIQVSHMQKKEDITKYPIAQFNSPPNDIGSCAKQELQALWEMFTSWLQPKKQSKEQMISQLIKIGHCKDRFFFKEQWESSGRNMGRFMESLIDECLKPPTMVSTLVDR